VGCMRNGVLNEPDAASGLVNVRAKHPKGIVSRPVVNKHNVGLVAELGAKRGERLKCKDKVAQDRDYDSKFHVKQYIAGILRTHG
jgi:hypothetical protein